MAAAAAAPSLPGALTAGAGAEAAGGALRPSSSSFSSSGSPRSPLPTPTNSLRCAQRAARAHTHRAAASRGRPPRRPAGPLRARPLPAAVAAAAPRLPPHLVPPHTRPCPALPRALTDVVVLDVLDELRQGREVQPAAPEPAGVREEGGGGDACHGVTSRSPRRAVPALPGPAAAGRGEAGAGGERDGARDGERARWGWGEEKEVAAAASGAAEGRAGLGGGR